MYYSWLQHNKFLSKLSPLHYNLLGTALVGVAGPLLLHSSSAAGGQVVCDAPNGLILKVSALDGAWMRCELGESETGHELVPVYLHCSSWKSIARLSDGADARRAAEATWREQSRSA